MVKGWQNCGGAQNGRRCVTVPVNHVTPPLIVVTAVRAPHSTILINLLKKYLLIKTNIAKYLKVTKVKNSFLILKKKTSSTYYIYKPTKLI
jgi:hypothetical protein